MSEGRFPCPECPDLGEPDPDCPLCEGTHFVFVEAEFEFFTSGAESDRSWDW